MTRHRIYPYYDNKWIVKRKGWFFWNTIMCDMFDFLDTKTFDTKEQAKLFIDKRLVAEAINLVHMSQPYEEYP